MADNNAINLSSLVPINIETEMKRSYLDYAMSVIVSRALPDCRDGLKPVHRRILYAMHEMNNYPDKPYKKSARIVGDVMGKYHPHGDSAIYMAMVRMAQDFSLRAPLIDGQGNYGSMDGDAPAAMRYTETRLSKLAVSMLTDIDFNTVAFQDNYDGHEKEPLVLPARFPNLLVNGTSGIAVGMATNIPPHNLGEVIEGCCAYIDNPEITIDELLEFIPAPDFPTGGIILGGQRAKSAIATGRGSIIMRAKTEIEEIGGKSAIVIHEIPYQVNKSELLKHIESLSKEKVIEGITEMRDESNKLGVRMVIELRKDAVPDVVLSQLFKFTPLQTSFGVNILALNKGRPEQMNVRDIIVAFTDFRVEVVTNRITFLLNKARDRAHVCIGLSLTIANIDEVIALIKASKDPAEAKVNLMEKMWDATTVLPLLALVDDYRNNPEGNKCKFTDEQATAILEMKLQRLTGLEKDRIDNELQKLAEEIKEYLGVLGDRAKLFTIIKEELAEIKEKFATPRRTEIQINEDEVDMEDLIQREDMVVTTTMGGYIKRVPLATYRAQRRGGKGRSAMSVSDDDMTTDIIAANTHTALLFFSDKGKVYRMKVYKLPLGTPQAKGRALVNLLPLEQDEKINNITALPEDKATWESLSIMFATAQGNIRRNDLAAFSNINANGKLAIRLDEGDKLIGVNICHPADHVMLATRQGKALRFPVDAIRVFKSRTSDGVRGIKLAKANDAVVSMAILGESAISIEKREEFLKLPIDARIAYKLEGNEEQFKEEFSKLSFNLVNFEEAKKLALEEQLILSITEKGYGKRTSAFEYRVAGRGGQGVMNIDTSERNGSVAASFPVCQYDQVIMLTDGGTLIRTNVKDIRITGRNAMGVRLINTAETEKVISTTKIIGSKEEVENADSGSENAGGTPPGEEERSDTSSD
ncbi:MAG: DNA gyrase subunit A [Rickettsiales bacterium]